MATESSTLLSLQSFPRLQTPTAPATTNTMITTTMNTFKALTFRLHPTSQTPFPQPSHFKTLKPSSLTSLKARLKFSNSRRSFIFISLPITALFHASPSLGFDPVTAGERDASSELSRRIEAAVRLLDLGRDLQARGEFSRALDCYTQVINDYKDLAFSEYARVGRALILYEIGDRQQAIAEMEDVSISLKGYPEIHAALAAALYTDKHASLLAENQFTIATLLDPHYADISYGFLFGSKIEDLRLWPGADFRSPREQIINNPTDVMGKIKKPFCDSY